MLDTTPNKKQRRVMELISRISVSTGTRILFSIHPTEIIG